MKQGAGVVNDPGDFSTFNHAWKRRVYWKPPGFVLHSCFHDIIFVWVFRVRGPSRKIKRLNLPRLLRQQQQQRMLRREIINPRSVSCRSHVFLTCGTLHLLTSAKQTHSEPQALFAHFFQRLLPRPLEHLAWILLYTVVHEDREKCLEPLKTTSNDPGPEPCPTQNCQEVPCVCLVATEAKEPTYVHFKPQIQQRIRTRYPNQPQQNHQTQRQHLTSCELAHPEAQSAQRRGFMQQTSQKAPS